MERSSLLTVHQAWKRMETFRHRL